MSSIFTLSFGSAIVSAIIATALILMSIYSTIISGTTLIGKTIVYSVFFMMIDLVIFLAVIDSCATLAGFGEYRSFLGEQFAMLQPHFRMLVLSIMLVIGMMRWSRVDKINHSDITQFSVGEAMEIMPMGILFHGESGIVLQANKTMDDLCYAITGKSLNNGYDFWNDLVNSRVVDGMEVVQGESPVITMPDGKSWMFKNRRMKTPLGPVEQIFGIDVTKEQGMLKELEEENVKLQEMNLRLRRYNSIVDETIRREELLATKIMVHDRMGEELLAVRMLIENKDAPVTPETVYSKWNQSLKLLIKEAQMDQAQAEAKTSDVDISQVEAQTKRLMQAAEHLGIELQMIGDMPEDFDVMQLICVGIQECMTNAIQHANATEMYVSIKDQGDEYLVNYSNNGDLLTEPIKEGGGLSLFRQSADKYGAKMEYVDSTRFNLMLHIPKIKVYN